MRVPHLDDGDVRLYQGEALEVLREMPSESVQMIVTSPPFWGLRSYIADDHADKPLEIGLEPTPDEWCARLVAVMREARRVLRSDGVCWIEVGDTYTAGGGSDWSRWKGGQTHNTREGVKSAGVAKPAGIKQKDLVGAPWLLAFALRADGWYLRSDTIWARPNPMPESVTDRPTKAHSYVFLLAKSPRYYYDADAIREPYIKDARKITTVTGTDASEQHRDGERWPNPAGANARSVWTIPTEPTPFKHFATFPQALVERCIKAGCPELVCGECGSPRIEYPYDLQSGSNTEAVVRGMRNGVPADAAGDSLLFQEMQLGQNGSQPDGLQGLDARPEGLHPDPQAGPPDGIERGLRDGAPPSDGGAPRTDADEERGCAPREQGEGRQPHREPDADGEGRARTPAETADRADRLPALRRDDPGQRACASCGCEDFRPGVVLDPFVGSGTTCLVARRLGRHAIGIELNAEYLAIASTRLQQLSLLS